MKQIFYTSLLLLASGGMLTAQTIHGKITDRQAQPVDGGTLGEVTVRAERPQVKVEGGKLTYDIPQLISNKTATNAFEVIKLLPGVTGSDDEIGLAGAGRLSIILNGQLTSMTLGQLIQLLKTMPASRVQKAEIMYAAPARYNIKGAVINVILDKAPSDTPAFQGEAGVDYQQRHYAGGAGSCQYRLLHTELPHRLSSQRKQGAQLCRRRYSGAPYLKQQRDRRGAGGTEHGICKQRLGTPRNRLYLPQ